MSLENAEETTAGEVEAGSTGCAQMEAESVSVDGMVLEAVPDKDDLILGYSVHPAANAYPLMVGAEFEELCNSIRKNMMVHDSVMFHEGKILDGRNRLRAVELIQKETSSWVTCPMENWNPSSEEQPADFVERKNSQRRHLTDSQKAAVAVALNYERVREDKKRRQEKSRFRGSVDSSKDPIQVAPAGEAVTPNLASPSRDQKSTGSKRNPTTSAELAKTAGVGRNKVDRATRVLKEKGREGLQEVIDGKVDLSPAASAAEGKTKKAAKPETTAELVGQHWQSMKKKFAVADYPEMRKELRKLLDEEDSASGQKPSRAKKSTPSGPTAPKSGGVA